MFPQKFKAPEFVVGCFDGHIKPTQTAETPHHQIQCDSICFPNTGSGRGKLAAQGWLCLCREAGRIRPFRSKLCRNIHQVRDVSVPGDDPVWWGEEDNLSVRWPSLSTEGRHQCGSAALPGQEAGQGQGAQEAGEAQGGRTGVSGHGHREQGDGRQCGSSGLEGVWGGGE